ncbi:hypothetical protein ACQVBX_05375 [Dyella sp. KULCS107]|jgi:hypothetical protein
MMSQGVKIFTQILCVSADFRSFRLPISAQCAPCHDNPAPGGAGVA